MPDNKNFNQITNNHNIIKRMEKPPIINNINNKYLPMQNNNIKIEKNNNDINNKIKPKENTNNIIIKNKAPIIEKAKTYLIQKTKEQPLSKLGNSSIP